VPENLSILEPDVLSGVVEKLTAPEQMTLLNRIPRKSHPFPTAEWDVIKGSRMVAKPNVPNSEAHIVPRLGISRESATFVYLREKKIFEPTTLHWLRAPGTAANLQRAEDAVLREVKDLNQRFDNFAEWMLWRSWTGSLVFDYEDVQATVDYKIPASHKPTPATGWATASAVQIVDDVTAWKRLILRDGRVPAREAWCTDVTMARVFRAFASAGTALLSDRARDQYYASGTLPGFLQLDWNLVDSYYDTDAGNPAQFLADDALFITNLSDGRPIELYEGPTADDEAPEGLTGKFSKTWKEKDPSARQFLIEWHLLPVITRPEQFVYVAKVTP
jgi:hypothetical protein